VFLSVHSRNSLLRFLGLCFPSQRSTENHQNGQENTRQLLRCASKRHTPSLKRSYPENSTPSFHCTHCSSNAIPHF
jgi:hypothetical protein